MLIDRKGVIAEAKSAARTTLQQAEMFTPYQEGVVTQTVTAGKNPLQPTYRLKVLLRNTDPDSRPQACTVEMTEQPPKQSHWTNLFVRQPHTFFYGEASEPNGNPQTVLEVRRRQRVIFRHTEFSDKQATEGRLGLGDIQAIRRMTPVLTSLTGEMLKGFDHDQPTQPL